MPIRLFELAGADPARVFSPYCWRTCMALAHKRLEWETIPWRFSDKAALKPYGSETVPVLLDGDYVVVDSWAIAEHLDRVHGGAPLFDSPQARAEGLFVKHWTERVLHPLLTRMLVVDILQVLDEGDRTYFRETRERRLGARLEDVVADRDAHREKFLASLEPLRAMLGSQPCLGGAEPNYADYVVFGAFMWARAVSPYPLLGPDDPVHAWRARLLDRFAGLARRAPGFDN